jgi:hypothetical protein
VGKKENFLEETSKEVLKAINGYEACHCKIEQRLTTSFGEFLKGLWMQWSS